MNTITTAVDERIKRLDNQIAQLTQFKTKQFKVNTNRMSNSSVTYSQVSKAPSHQTLPNCRDRSSYAPKINQSHAKSKYMQTKYKEVKVEQPVQSKLNSFDFINSKSMHYHERPFLDELRKLEKQCVQ